MGEKETVADRNLPGLRLPSEVQQFLNLRRSSQFREGCARVEGSGATARDAEAAKGGVNTKGCGIGSIYQHRLLGKGWKGILGSQRA